MTQEETDPLSIIAALPPDLSAGDAERIAEEHFGIAATAKTLVSERDQNFRLEADDGSRFVLKIANAAEADRVTLFQIEALLHLERSIQALSLPVRVPAIVRTLSGASHLVVDSGGAAHLTRMVSYLPGVPLSTVPRTPLLARRMGDTLAALGQGLAGFSHPGSDQSLLWDMKRALELRRLLSYIDDPDIARLVATSLDEFESNAQPVLARARSQVIHNDMHGDNVLVSRENPESITGVIDFGDMLESPLIIDLGVAAAYLPGEPDDPLSLIVEFVAGYHQRVRLEPPEIAILIHLIRARLAATIAIHHWRASARDADDPYLQVSLDSGRGAFDFLARLYAMSDDAVRERLHEACRQAGSQPLS